MPRVRVGVCGHRQEFESRFYDLPVMLREEVLVGSAPYCRIVLPEMRGIAPVHACIVLEERGYMITDMTAPLKVWENGSATRLSRLLEPGVERRLGALSIVLEAEPQVVDAEPVQVMPAQPERQQALSAPAPFNQDPLAQMPLPSRMSAPMPQYMDRSVQLQVMPVVITSPAAPREEKSVRKTSKFKKKEASLLMARFHRHKMHNSCLWMMMWMVLTLLFLLAVICLAMPMLFPDMVKEGDKLIERVIKDKIQPYLKSFSPSGA